MEISAERERYTIILYIYDPNPYFPSTKSLARRVYECSTPARSFFAAIELPSPGGDLLAKWTCAEVLIVE